MPTAEEHLKKYKLNKDLLNSNEMDIKTSKHYEWITTVAFYSALHLIERDFYLTGITEDTQHSRNHANRHFLICSATKYKNIRREYMQLENSCWKARYMAERISKNDAIKMLEYLGKIEKFFL